MRLPAISNLTGIMLNNMAFPMDSPIYGWTGLPGMEALFTWAGMVMVWKTIIHLLFGTELCPLTAAAPITGILILMEIGEGDYRCPMWLTATLVLSLILPMAAS